MGAAAAVLFLVRHAAHALRAGVLPGRTPGVHLSDEGRAQAEALAARLAGAQLGALYSSPRERARETAEVVGLRCGIDVEVRKGLDEIDYGVWTGRPIDALSDVPAWRAWNERRATARVPGGETMRDVQARVVAELAELSGRHAGGRAALFTHADVIRAAVAHVLQMPLDEVLRLDVDLASVSALEIGATSRLLSLNA